jgi:hypothetical protein
LLLSMLVRVAEKLCPRFEFSGTLETVTVEPLRVAQLAMVLGDLDVGAGHAGHGHRQRGEHDDEDQGKDEGGAPRSRRGEVSGPFHFLPRTMR